MAKKKRSAGPKKHGWFSSTVIVLLLGFCVLFCFAWAKYGLKESLDVMLKYALGMSATALFFAFLGFIFRKSLMRVLKKL